MDLRIRNATIADLPALVELWVETAKVHEQLDPGFYTIASDAAQQARTTLRDEVHDYGLLFSVAEVDDQVVASIECEIRNIPMFQDRQRGYIFNLSVKEGFRGLGIGRRLLEHAFKWIQSKGVKMVMINVADYNEPALRLYQELGFQPANRNLYLKL